MKDYIELIDCGITVCDENGIISDMNNKSTEIFKNYGGKELIGKNLFDFHNENSKNQIKKMMSDGTSNIYSIEKNGKKKLICQYAVPKENNKFGLIEISIDLPEEVPHFVRG